MHLALAPRPSKLSFMAWGKVIHRIVFRYVFVQRSRWGFFTCRLIILLPVDRRSPKSANTNSRFLLHPFTSQAKRNSTASTLTMLLSMAVRVESSMAICQTVYQVLETPVNVPHGILWSIYSLNVVSWACMFRYIAWLHGSHLDVLWSSVESTNSRLVSGPEMYRRGTHFPISYPHYARGVEDGRCILCGTAKVSNLEN